MCTNCTLKIPSLTTFASNYLSKPLQIIMTSSHSEKPDDLISETVLCHDFGHENDRCAHAFVLVTIIGSGFSFLYACGEKS